MDLISPIWHSHQFRYRIPVFQTRLATFQTEITFEDYIKIARKGQICYIAHEKVRIFITFPQNFILKAIKN